MAEPVTVDGRTVIEAGAPARGTVVDAKGMGHFKGGAMLHVRLVSVSMNGRERQIETSAHGAQLKGKGKRSTIAIAGGAGVGAILGGIFGGGKGAAIRLCQIDVILWHSLNRHEGPTPHRFQAARFCGA